MANPDLRGKLLSFFIPQTMAKKAMGRCKRSPRLPSVNNSKSGQGTEPQPSWTAGEKVPACTLWERMGVHLEGLGNTCLVTPLMPVVGDEADPKAATS